jgi:hypothetical protein
MMFDGFAFARQHTRLRRRWHPLAPAAAYEAYAAAELVGKKSGSR